MHQQQDRVHQSQISLILLYLQVVILLKGKVTLPKLQDLRCHILILFVMSEFPEVGRRKTLKMVEQLINHHLFLNFLQVEAQ